MVATLQGFFFSSLADLHHLAFVTRESARLSSTRVYGQCSPRESVRVISPEYIPLSACLRSFSCSLRFILTGSIYRDVLIAIVCLIKLRHIHSRARFISFLKLTPSTDTTQCTVRILETVEDIIILLNITFQA